MSATLPTDARALMALTWAEIEPHYTALAAREVTAANVTAWLTDWTRLSRLVNEAGARLSLAYDLNTADAEAEQRFFAFLENIAPHAETAEQKLKEKLLASGLEPEGLTLVLRNMRAEAALFRDENLPLITEERKLGSLYDKTVGLQTVEWEGQEIPVTQLRPVFEDPDRVRRERAWRLAHTRQLQDRATLNQLWSQLFELRGRIAANANHADYRSYTWQSYLRFDYTPADCATFQRAIEQVCVPAATRLLERHRQRLGVDRLRPWDLANGEWGRPASPVGETPLKPYRESAELIAKSAAIVERVDARLGGYFKSMREEQLLDLDNRKGKAPGGYCTYFAHQRRPFIFMNAVGTHTDVQVLLHEAGHAVHAFEASALVYHQQQSTPMEFNEVASMGMELLAAPYLTAEHGGFYSSTEAARARVEHLENLILFWPYMAVVDAFQHWAYTHPAEAVRAEACNEQWTALWRRFMPGVDWSGLDAELVTGWHRKLHIFRAPFYYVEYGLAQLGATQVWRNALADQAGAVAHYRAALALGGTATLPQLYATAGAKFAFDPETLGQMVQLIEKTVTELE